MKFTITIPEKISLNVAMRKHYRAINDAKQQWHYAVMEAAPPQYDGPFPIDIEFHYFLNGKPLDSSNAGFMSKALEDALVVYGVIPNDDPRYVRKATNWSDKALPGEIDRVEVEFSPA